MYLFIYLFFLFHSLNLWQPLDLSGIAICLWAIKQSNSIRQKDVCQFREETQNKRDDSQVTLLVCVHRERERERERRKSRERKYGHEEDRAGGGRRRSC